MSTLFEHICADATLLDAWHRVERKGSQGGIDHITVQLFQQRPHENLLQLRADLLSGRYVPAPFQKLNIPKLNKPGETRPLQMPTVRDKIAQEAVRSVIAPVLEKTFVDCSYAYRPGKGPQKAIRRVQHYLSMHKSWVALADIDRFFDTMDQELTLAQVQKHIPEPEILRLLALWIKMGAVDRRGRWLDPVRGVAQGSVISPLLSNTYLTPFDAHLTQKGYAVVRYADNFILLESSPEAATRALEDARTFLQEHLKLQLNVDPNPIATLDTGFVFLGIYFQGTQRRIAHSKIEQMKAELRQLWQRYARVDMPQLVTELNASVLGWQRYYGMVQPSEQFQELDTYIAEGVARALAIRLGDGRLTKNADLPGTLQDLAFLAPVPAAQRSAALQRIARRARQLQQSTMGASAPRPEQAAGTRHPASSEHPRHAKGFSVGARLGDSGQHRKASVQNITQDHGVVAPPPPTAQDVMPASVEAVPPAAPALETPALPADTPASSTPETTIPPVTTPQEVSPVTSSPTQGVAAVVRRQKRRYMQQAAQSAELVIAEPGVFLGKTSQRIVVKKQRRVLKQIPLRELRHVVITTSGVTLSSAMITFCAQAQVPIDFLSPRGDPVARLYTPLDALGHTGLQQLRAVHDGRGLHLAKTFVVGKLRNQFNLMKYYHKYRKRVDVEFAQAFDDVEQKFETLLTDLKAYAPEGEYDVVRQRLFAFEGHGGNLYWQMIRLLLEDDVEFGGRQRHGATDLVNSLLNYGYGMLYPRVQHAILLAGLNPCISFLHTFQDDKPTLSFDLIEEFRSQAVDRVVFGMITKGEELALDPQAGRLTKATVHKLVTNVLERLATPIRYRGHDRSLQDIIRLQAKLLAAHLNGKGRYRSFLGRW